MCNVGQAQARLLRPMSRLGHICPSVARIEPWIPLFSVGFKRTSSLSYLTFYDWDGDHFNLISRSEPFPRIGTAARPFTKHWIRHEAIFLWVCPQLERKKAQRPTMHKIMGSWDLWIWASLIDLLDADSVHLVDQKHIWSESPWISSQSAIFGLLWWEDYPNLWARLISP